MVSAVLGTPGPFQDLLRLIESEEAAPKPRREEAAAAAVSVAAAGGYQTELRQLRAAAAEGGLSFWAIKDSNGMASLHHASSAGHLSTVQLLLELATAERGHDDPTARTGPLALLLGQDACGMTPLMYACEKGYADIASRLLEASSSSSDLEVVNKGGLTAFGLAVQAGSAEIIQAIVQQFDSAGNQLGRLLERRDGIGYTPLRHAAFFQHVHVAECLVGLGANVNARDNWSDTVRESSGKKEI